MAPIIFAVLTDDGGLVIKSGGNPRTSAAIAAGRAGLKAFLESTNTGPRPTQALNGLFGKARKRLGIFWTLGDV